MTKGKLKEVSKELNVNLGVAITDIDRVMRNADTMLQMLKERAAQFQHQEEIERQRLKIEQQQEAIRQQPKAWTQPDDHLVPELRTAQEKTEKPDNAEKEQKDALKLEKASDKASVQDQIVQSVAKTEGMPVSEEPQKTAVQDSAVELKPAAPQKPQMVAPIAPRARPLPQNPSAPAPGYGRPAGNYPPPAGPYGRPAGPYGRPAPAPAGEQRPPYGRPAMRPGVPGQAPAQGAYGRPAPGAPSFGNRPATPYQGRPPMQRPGMVPGKPGFSGAPYPGSRMPAKPRAEELPQTLEKERVSNYDPNKKNYVRQHDPEHVSKTRKQLSKINQQFSGYDDDVVRGGKKRLKKLSAQQMMSPIKIEKAYMTAERITVKDLTERIGKPANEILKKLLLLGNMANINSELDFDTAALVCQEFGVELEIKMEKSAEEVLFATDVVDSEESLKERPPVITIMGHVDHGKTSLLDYIRDTHVTRSEAGGITQHIGAYSVTLNDRQITFLDTPGHEAFTAMRARGAQATDIAVLVVAADDGVMPQTIEAIRHAKAAKVPILVAINKMDKPSADPERIKQDLTKYELVCEEWGGETIMVPVSAKTGDGVDKLLEMILLTADVMQLRGNPDRLARGIIIEAKLDKARGTLATVLLKNGTLRIGDNIIAGMASGRVRAMMNDRGESVREAGPSMPVEVSGFSSVPQAGDEMYAVDDERLVKQVAKEREDQIKAMRTAAGSAMPTLDNLYENIKEGQVVTLNILIKADVQGSAEAVRQSLERLSNNQVKIHILHSAVGAISKDDVNLAATCNATIIGFNIRPDSNAKDIAEKEKVNIRLYRIIYQAIEDIQNAMKGMLAPEYKENILGRAEVRNVYKITGSGTIAGCYVVDGKMVRNASVRLLRDNVIIFEGKLSSLRRFKDDVKEVAESYECGIGLENYNDIKEKDIIECFSMDEITD